MCSLLCGVARGASCALDGTRLYRRGCVASILYLRATWVCIATPNGRRALAAAAHLGRRCSGTRGNHCGCNDVAAAPPISDELSARRLLEHGLDRNSNRGGRRGVKLTYLAMHCLPTEGHSLQPKML
eukprot:360805-Chlamydomonas_euryale.AAC.2